MSKFLGALIWQIAPQLSKVHHIRVHIADCVIHFVSLKCVVYDFIVHRYCTLCLTLMQFRSYSGSVVNTVNGRALQSQVKGPYDGPWRILFCHTPA